VEKTGVGLRIEKLSSLRPTLPRYLGCALAYGRAIRYRGIKISSAQIDFIRRLMAEKPAIGNPAFARISPMWKRNRSV